MKLTYRLNQWESAFFGRAIFSARITHTAQGENAPAPMALAQIKVKADAFEQIAFLQQQQFQCVAGELEFGFELSAQTFAKNPAIQTACIGDIPALMAFNARIPFQTRFKPPYYSTAEIQKFYAQWFENAVLKAFDEVCFLFVEQQKIKGAVTVRQVGARAQIGLLAVLPEYQHQGIGKQLVQQAMLWAKAQGKTELVIATQTENAPAIRLYQTFQPVRCTRYAWFYQQGNAQ